MNSVYLLSLPLSLTSIITVFIFSLQYFTWWQVEGASQLTLTAGIWLAVCWLFPGKQEMMRKLCVSGKIYPFTDTWNCSPVWTHLRVCVVHVSSYWFFSQAWNNVRLQKVPMRPPCVWVCVCVCLCVFVCVCVCVCVCVRRNVLWF